MREPGDTGGSARDVTPGPDLVAALASGDPAALAWWREVQQRAADDPQRSKEPHYAIENRQAAGPPPGAERRVCAGCGFKKALGYGERFCPPCIDRGRSPQPVSMGGMRGADALRQLDDQYSDPAEVRSLAAQRERMRFAGQDAAGDLETLNEYARRLGVLLDGVAHRAGGA